MELQGVQFGRLTVLERATGTRKTAWVCACVCGVVVTKTQDDLRSGDTKTCGCIKREQLVARNKTPGLTDTPAYKKWRGMWSRVRSTDRKQNTCYVGVTVCRRWEKFENFLADMGTPPEGYSLDRVDNTKGYNKKNCRWVPLAEQARNTRRQRMYKGVCLSEAARKAGLSPDVVSDRVNKLGWSIERALSTPKRQQRS